MPVLKSLIACFLILCSVHAFGQNRETDSLLAVAKNGRPKEKTDALNALCIAVMYNDPAKAKQYAVQAISAAQAVSYAEGEGKAYIRLGIFYDVTGDYDSSVICYNTALDICLKAKNPKGAGSAYNNLGLVYGKQGRLKEAIDCFFKAMPFFEEINNKALLGNVHNNISLFYQRINEDRKAIHYALKAVEYYRELGDDENLGGTFTNLSVNYTALKNYDSSAYYVKQAITYNTKANNLYGLSTAYIDYGALMSKYFSDYETGRTYYAKALLIKTQLNDNEGISCVYSCMADNYTRVGDRKNALRYLLKAYTLSKEKELQNEILVTCQALAGFYKTSKNTDSVYYYLEQYNAAKDSIYTKDFKHSLAEAQTKYETKEKVLTIRSQQYQLSLKNYYIAGLISLIFLSLLVFYTFYNRYRFKQKTKLDQEIINQQDLATKAVIRAEENERRRVASDLHDSVGQMLSAIKINLSTFKENIPAENAERFEKIMDMADESCKEVRAISHNMMPNSLLKNGLVSAIREFIGQLNQSALTVNIETSGLNARLDDDVETVLYRVVQECVNNVVKHAKASRLDIQLIKDNEGIAITIEDNGIGFNTDTEHSGIGLKNLASRIGFLKGTADISAIQGKGTLIAIFIPKQNKP